MGIENFQIHPQLAADSHALFEWQHCHLRLHKNATLPWLIIIPETEQIEFHDLPTALQLKITHISQVSANYFKSAHGAEKINFAAIGNVVQQLHVHVIGRHHKDPLWPDVVWGNTLPEKIYAADQLIKISTSIKSLLDQST
jgi:diadenosine tetraphosphate (Ap4A) HIT family hydrolase